MTKGKRTVRLLNSLARDQGLTVKTTSRSIELVDSGGHVAIRCSNDGKLIPIHSKFDYGNWENDFGFLMLCMRREINLTTDFDVNIFAAQLEGKTDYVHDDDIKSSYEKSVANVFDMLSEDYKNFLIDKYFRDEKALISFISETIYSELAKAAIKANSDKIKRNYTEEAMRAVSGLNDKVNQKKKG